MRLGSLRVRIGVISDDDDSLNLVNELMRSTISTGGVASCSFYVPLLTPIAFLVFGTATEGSNKLLIRFHTGSKIHEDTFIAEEGTVRIYGERASATGFSGANFKLFATEETVEINILEADTSKLLGCFRYKHLEPSDVPQETDLALIDYSDDAALKSVEGIFNDENSLPPTPTMVAMADKSSKGRKRNFDELEFDEGDSSGADDTDAENDDITIIRSNLTPRGTGLLAPAAGSSLETPTSKPRKSVQSTPLRQTKLLKSFTPGIKASSSTTRAISNVKAEDMELKPMPRFEPSPSLQLLKDSHKKVAGLDGQIDKDELELDGLGDKRLVKINRAKANYDKAIVKADREYTADRARIEERIEQALAKRAEEVKKQDWLQEKAMENIDVIELSDDSASEAGIIDSDEE